MATIEFKDGGCVEAEGMVLWNEHYKGYHFALINHLSEADGMERLIVACYRGDKQLFEIVEGQFRRDILTEMTMYTVQMEFISKVQADCYALVNGHEERLNDIYERVCQAKSVVITANKDIIEGKILGANGQPAVNDLRG